MVHGKGARIQIILVPDALLNGEAIAGLMDRVVDRRDDGQNPGDKRDDRVRQDRARVERLARVKGIVCDG